MKKQKKISATPSIGTIGITVDRVNKRVKILSGQIFEQQEDTEDFIIDILVKNDEARELLAEAGSRFTARVLVPTGMMIEPFNYFFRMTGTIIEEARIRTCVGLDIVYLGHNIPGGNRLRPEQLQLEYQLSLNASRNVQTVPEPSDVSFSRLCSPLSQRDVAQLLEMYRLSFTDYLVPFNKALVQNAAREAIFFVARNKTGRIIASAIGESLRVGPLTLLEISEVATHPNHRVRGAASGCVRRVIQMGRSSLQAPVVAFWEARMWRNILGLGPVVGLTEFGGILHQHCKIGSPKEFTSIDQTGYGSLAVFYGR